ncbi:hypothetical protein DFH06DRAFT_40522 [Mycena polygramma]|nr:hypothetical protein DFH06DRAFT_40522 [Mycena polygramma]
MQPDTARNVLVSQARDVNDCDGWGSPCHLTDNPPCSCCNLAYILQAACDYCDGEKFPVTNWGNYSDDHGCSTMLNSTHSSTPVPSWATVMASETPTPTGTFDPQDSGSSPTSATLISISATSPSTPPSTGGPSSTSPPTRVSGSSRGKSQAGPIAGGIIGAIVVVAFIGAGLWYRARRRKRLAPSAAYRAALRSGAPPMPYQPVDRGSPKSSMPPQIDELSIDRPPSPWLPSRPVSIRSESRFREHT